MYPEKMGNTFAYKPPPPKFVFENRTDVSITCMHQKDHFELIRNDEKPFCITYGKYGNYFIPMSRMTLIYTARPIDSKNRQDLAIIVFDT